MINYQNIVELISNKDPEGLSVLFKCYGKQFYRYAVRKWHLSEDEAWDTVYRTLDTLVLKLSKYEFESEAHFNNFIYKVFTNFLRQHFRSHRNKQDDIQYVDFTEENGGEEESANSIRFDIDKKTFFDYYKTEAIENPNILVLNNALNTLSEEEQDILLMRAQGFSYDEIAKFLNVDNNQLKVRHHRAKQKLIKLLEDTKINPHEQP